MSVVLELMIGCFSEHEGQKYLNPVWTVSAGEELLLLPAFECVPLVSLWFAALPLRMEFNSIFEAADVPEVLLEDVLGSKPVATLTGCRGRVGGGGGGTDEELGFFKSSVEVLSCLTIGTDFFV